MLILRFNNTHDHVVIAGNRLISVTSSKKMKNHVSRITVTSEDDFTDRPKRSPSETEVDKDADGGGLEGWRWRQRWWLCGGNDCHSCKQSETQAESNYMPPAFLECWNTEKRYPSGVLIKVNVRSSMFLCVLCVCCMPLTEAHNC